MNHPLLRLSIALALLPGVAHAQNSPDDLGARAASIRELAKRATDQRIPDAERLAALDDSLAQRRALIQGAGADAPGSLLLEQIEAILSRFAWDGSDATAMFGILTHSQLDAVMPTAREAHDLCIRLIARLDREIAQADGAGDAQAQERLQRARELFAPLMRARAAVVLASLEPDPARRADLAGEAAASANALRAANDDLDARRAVILGQSALILSRHDAALEQFEGALARRSSLATRMEAQLGRALALLRTKGPGQARAALQQATLAPPFVIDNRPMVIPALLATDVEARIALAEADAAPEGPARDLALARAYNVLERLAYRAELGLEGPQRRSLALGKINTLAPRDADRCLALPPIVALARGVARSTDTDGFIDAVKLLESVTQPGSERLKALAELGPIALRTLADLRVSEAKAFEDDERLVPAIRLYQRAGKEYPRDEELALPGIINAIFYASRWTSSRPDLELPRTLHEESLRIGLDSFPDSRPARLWREQLANILLDQGKVDDALAQLDRAGNTGGLTVEGYVTLLRSLSAAMDGAENPDARALLAQRILERADGALKTADRVSSDAPDADHRAANTLRVLAYAASASSNLALSRPDAAKAAALRAVELAEPLNSRDTFRASLVALVHAQAYAGDFPDALAAAQRLAKGANETAPAACDILIDLATARARELDGAHRPDDARALARDVIVPAARLALEASLMHAPTSADRWRAALGEALARAGESKEAADVLADLIKRNGPDTRTLVWLGEAALALDNEADAYEAFLQVVNALEQRQSPTEHYWHAWSRTLEIFLRHNEDGSKTENVRATLARLRINDPSLGGEPYASRFAAIERAINAK